MDSPRTLDEDDVPRARWERAAGLGVVVVATCYILAIVNPGMRVWPPWDVDLGLLFADTTTNGGDMGAHVWWPQFLRDNWFGRLRLSGWAPDWYAGFPAGHYYFPLPAVLIALVDTIPFVPYNVAFKLVTVSGPLLLPAAAYAFARGIRAPWPAPPAFAVAAMGMLVQTRSGWHIYGGNIGSTLAGEFSFTLALALALFGLGALGRTLDTGRRAWVPAALLAAAAMSHVVVAFFAGIVAVFMFVSRRPLRTWPVAMLVGGVAIALTSVWSVPLLLRHGYTQSMRYGKIVPDGDWSLPGWMFFVFGPVERAIEGFVRALGRVPGDSASNPQQLWLPWWMWVLSAVAIVAAGWYRRRSTLVLVAAAVTFGVLFVQWPEHAVWNARWLPFWMLSWGFVAAMGATEVLRLVALGAQLSLRWIRAGDLHDARAHAWIAIARDADGAVDPELRSRAVDVVATRDFDQEPPGWEPPPGLQDRWVRTQAAFVGRLTLAVLVAVAGITAANRGWDARDDNPSIAIAGWARWNYSGYEAKAAWPEYREIMDKMGALEPGRALWEPSATEGDPINRYGTSLALELLPYWTDGRIGSMEGLYFESSATTSFHFLTVSEVSRHPSNPVRGLRYGNIDTDFDQGVRHMEMLGVRYFMAWTTDAIAKADAHPDLRLVEEIDDHDGADPLGWRVYELENWSLVEGLAYEPVVASTRGGTYSQCWSDPWNNPNAVEPRLHGWECKTARWWRDGTYLDRPWAQSGPSEWERIDADDLGAAPGRRLDPVLVRDVVEDVDRISFSVDRVGVPVVVKVSYFPNWEAKGADGPYRLAPNMMVVVPTDTEVTLSYGFTPVDWLGRMLTVLGIAGLVLLVRWKGARRHGAEQEPGGDTGVTASEPPAAADAGAAGPGDVPPPPDRSEPAPAVP